MASHDSLGARLVEGGVRFSLWSRHAESVELCLFERPEAAVPRARHRLERDGSAGGGDRGELWSVTVPGLGEGALYGYRVDGPYRPAEGLLFNSSKLLVDPWARAITGEPVPSPNLFGHAWGTARPELSYDASDSAGAMPKCVVVGEPNAPIPGERPRTPWRDTVIYETHVRGLTRLHPGVPEELRGTYLGLARQPVLDHLLSLGVTAVELLPPAQSASEAHLMASGRRNYWGYATLGFFAPHAGYATAGTGAQVAEFREMVRRLHSVGLEVLIDVVYNHTPEGGWAGPTLSLKGIDWSTYYRLDPRRRHRPVDWTGTGNTLDVREPIVRRLILDSLRHWAGVYGVDGFRFDLAPVVGRDPVAFDAAAAIFRAIAEDPLLSTLKLIAEPWDLGPDGYCLGRFPAPWREWNDRFRRAARGAWRGEASGAALGELATRLAGSEDVFGGASSRGPLAGINYVTSHDGFTLRDLVSYARKHNHANGEDGRDGSADNQSRNWGAEGETDDPSILAARARARRNLLATVFLAQGVPMLLHGDELGRTQRGNNNAYCQDNEISWVDWGAVDEEMLRFVRRLVALRRALPALRRSSWLGTNSARWLHADGRAIEPDHWHDPALSSVVMMLLDEGDDALASLAVLIHAGAHARTFERLDRWLGASPRRRLDTSTGEVHAEHDPDRAIDGRAIEVAGRSIQLLEREGST